MWIDTPVRKELGGRGRPRGLNCIARPGHRNDLGGRFYETNS